ncbi:dihydrodipicolinate synthase family protein [Pedobacter frigoris]|uniref:Dihydrodipicolinate synthase family protein n=1 Tax=Pedobacter frigoris TaxID=2571272 RepID=A0A4U1CQ69_9SPHI|nr:dihydrodipicolinate synthase family protein [Pedobacter frigoris]TKC08955.1 dihydrodipicolinate synthase family protein [Pedobacter frigoris]
MNKINWNGVFPALLTPFTAEDKIDLETFKINLTAQLEAGVDGIILGGSLGEASSLSNDEKKQLYFAAREFLPSNFPILINIAEQTTEAAIKLATEAEAYGADGFMLLPPMRYYADSEETLEYFKAVAKSTKLPIMLYNNPVDYKIMITLDMFEELLPFENIEAVKESTRDITNITRMINRFGDRFKILTGVDPLALESLVMGAHGWVAGLVDAFPAETVAIYKLVKAGEITKAIAIYRWFMPLLELDTDPKLVQYIKLAAVATGIGTETVRAPRLQLSGEERERVIKVIDDALAVRPELPDYKNIKETADA